MRNTEEKMELVVGKPLPATDHTSSALSMIRKTDFILPEANSANMNNAIAIQMAARIFRASINRLDMDLDEIIGSSEFQFFCTQKGLNIPGLTPYFDTALYLDRFQAHSRFEINPVLHFCRFGQFHGIAPTLLFDAAYLRAQLGWARPGDFEANSGKPLARKGKIKSCQDSDVVDLFVAVLENTEPPYLDPHPLFDSELWARGCSDLNGQHPVISFLTARNFNTHPFSPYFSVAFVTKRQPFLRNSSNNPLLLYLRDVANGKINDVNPMFHSLYYQSISGVNKTDLISYYLVHGVKEGLPPNPFAEEELAINDFDRISGLFQDKFLDYLQCNSDLA